MDEIDINNKNEMLLSMHHKVRNPLNVVLGFTQILHYDKNLTPLERKMYFKIISDKTTELLNIMDDLYDLTLNSCFEK